MPASSPGPKRQVLVPRGNPAANAEQLQRILRSAVARACPRELDSEREDLVQTAMLRLLERGGEGEDSEIRSTSYLVKVAFHTMVDVMRRLNRRRAAGVEEMEGPRSALAAEVSGPSARPEVSPALRDCLARLVSSRRHAVTLYLQGFTAREAGRMLHLEEKAIRNLIFRGIHDLRRCLVEKGVTP
jgi:RNA polymerase sigma factor (sigma-70 family)